MKGVLKMKFVKGMIAGMVVACGAYMMYEECTIGPSKMMKKGKKMIKKLGI